MGNFYLPKTANTPEINFDSEKGILKIEGRSIPENPQRFYEPLVQEHLAEYIKNPCDETEVTIFLDYFNTSSSMWIFKLLKAISNVANEGKSQLSINWCYDEPENLEIGEEYESLVDVKFNMVKVDTEED